LYFANFDLVPPARCARPAPPPPANKRVSASPRKQFFQTGGGSVLPEATHKTFQVLYSNFFPFAEGEIKTSLKIKRKQTL